MDFKKSKYYNKELLGEDLYNLIFDKSKIFTIYEFFKLNKTQSEYHVKDEKDNYEVKICDDHYELDCKNYDGYLFLVFDKPVHVVGKYCACIIAPEIIVENEENTTIYCCVSNKATINNKCKYCYEIYSSKINDIYFYNSKIRFWYAEINAFFIFNGDLFFSEHSNFSIYYKVKIFGKSANLKERMLNYKKFKQGIIHIE